MSSSLSIDILIKGTEHALSVTRGRGGGGKEAKYQLFQKKKTQQVLSFLLQKQKMALRHKVMTIDKSLH